MLKSLQEESGIEIPTLSKEPHLFEEARWLWVAFCLLSEKRGITESGPQSITMADIAAYAVFEEIAGEHRRQMFLHIVTLLDREWLEEMMRRRKKAAKDAERRAKHHRRK